MDKSARILVIDDDRNIKETIIMILEDEGYVVDCAETGSEAIKKTEATAYNVVLIDIRLPDMDGVELLTKIRNLVPRTRKIIMTGYPSIQNAIEALNKSADAYVIKPIDVEKLLSIIREQIRLQETEEKFSEQKVAEFIERRVKDSCL